MLYRPTMNAVQAVFSIAYTDKNIDTSGTSQLLRLTRFQSFVISLLYIRGSTGKVYEGRPL